MRSRNSLAILRMSIASIMLVLLSGSLTSSCKSITSLTGADAEASSQLSHLGHPGHERVPRLASPDCEVWGFYLLATMYTLLYEQRLRDLRDIQASYRHLGDDNPYGTSLSARPDMYEVLPTKQARAVIDAVLEREGSTCSRELLYETPCRMNRSLLIGHIDVHERYKDNPPRTMIAADRFSSNIEYRYFEDVMGFTMNDEVAAQYEQSFKDHLTQSPDSPAEMYSFACNRERDRCGSTGNEFVRYGFKNSAALCLLIKHHDFLQAQGLLDLTDVERFQLNLTEVVAEDLAAFGVQSSETTTSPSSE